MLNAHNIYDQLVLQELRETFQKKIHILSMNSQSLFRYLVDNIYKHQFSYLTNQSNCNKRINMYISLQRHGTSGSSNGAPMGPSCSLGNVVVGIERLF